MGAAFSTGRMAVCWKTKTGGVDRRVLAVLLYSRLPLKAGSRSSDS